MADEKTLEVATHPDESLMANSHISKTGKIDGTVYLIKNDQKDKASDVEIEVIDEEGKVIKKTKTARDGFYMADKVPPGTYWVQVSEAQRKRLNLKTVEAQKVILTREDPVISGVDFTLELNMRKNIRQRLNESSENEKVLLLRQEYLHVLPNIFVIK